MKSISEESYSLLANYNVCVCMCEDGCGSKISPYILPNGTDNMWKVALDTISLSVTWKNHWMRIASL